MVARKTYSQDSIQSPFGMVMPGRNWTAGTAEGYGFGFNGKLKDDDIIGATNSYDFGARIYDARIGKWLSTDPQQLNYAFASPYAFALNTPIQAFDPDGKKVYFIVQLTIIEFDGDEAVVKPSGKFIVLDASDSESLKTYLPQITTEDVALINSYNLAKSTEMGKAELEKYEQSQTDDLYYFASSLGGSPDAAGHTTYDYKDLNSNGKFDVSDISGDNELIYEHAILDYGKIEGVAIQDPLKRIHVIAINSQDLTTPAPIAQDIVEEVSKNMEETGIQGGLGYFDQRINSLIAIVHEPKAHISYCLEDKICESYKQHEKWYGQENGNSASWATDSPQETMYNQASKAYGYDK